jgi:transmembrane sensor
MTLPDFLKYFSGKTSAEESKQIKEWMKDPGNESDVRGIMGKIWTHADLRLTGKKPDFDLILSLIHQRIHKELNHAHHFIRLRNIYDSFSRVAAVLIFPLLFLVVYFYLKSNDHINSDTSGIQQEIYTKPGIRTKITLADGTLVWLHDGTILRYPERFNKEERRVFVDGEAYFEVASDPDHPFVVENPMMETLVTGTKFNINAYASDQYFEVTLLEGKVHLQKGPDKYELNPGQQIQYDSQSGDVSQLYVNPYNSVAWINGKLILQDEFLHTAVKKISRWYNIEIVLLDQELQNYFLTATIENEKPEQTLKLIAMAIPVDFTVAQKKVGTESKQIFYLNKR